MRLPRRPRGFAIGERVVIVAGALRGMTGLVQERVAPDRVHIVLDDSPGTFVRIHIRHLRRHSPDSAANDNDSESR
jgi:hypothetical protein